MSNTQDSLNVSAFLSGGTNPSPTPLQTHLLKGWKPNTLNSYNSAVKKFLKFYEDKEARPFQLPASTDDIYKFCLSVGRKEGNYSRGNISAKSLSKYLSALQAWHLFHQVHYPHNTKDTIKVMLRASEQADASTPSKSKKPAVMLEHLLALYYTLNNSSPQDKAILDCVICAFWGLARLAEVTYDSSEGEPPWTNSILVGDVLRPATGLSHVIIKVRGAKTAKAGVAQDLLLNAQPNCLCPVKAVLRRASTASTSHDSLFGFTADDGSRYNLRRTVVVQRCQQIWRQHGWNSLSGHSFRVGGASLRAALGIPHADIQQLGRWTSTCYLISLRDYSVEDLRKTNAILQLLNSSPESETA